MIQKLNRLKHKNNDNFEVDEEENIDEAVTAESKASNKMEIDLKEERNAQAY